MNNFEKCQWLLSGLLSAQPIAEISAMDFVKQHETELGNRFSLLMNTWNGTADDGQRQAEFFRSFRNSLGGAVGRIHDKIIETSRALGIIESRDQSAAENIYTPEDIKNHKRMLIEQMALVQFVLNITHTFMAECNIPEPARKRPLTHKNIKFIIRQ